MPAAVDSHAPDVVLVDRRLPRVDGITATRRLRARGRPPEVIVLTTFDSDENVLSAGASGSRTHRPTSAPPSAASPRVSRCSPSITRRLKDRAAVEAGAYDRARTAIDARTPRERDVVLAVAHGHTNAEIASELFMSVTTVKAHVSHILSKLDVGNRTEVALLAHDAGLP